MSLCLSPCLTSIMMHIKEHGWNTLSTQCYGWMTWSCTRKGSAILSLARIPIRQFELSEFQAEPVEVLITPLDVSPNLTKTVYEHLWSITLKNCERYRNYKLFVYEPLEIHKLLAASGRMRSWGTPSAPPLIQGCFALSVDQWKLKTVTLSDWNCIFTAKIIT